MSSRVGSDQFQAILTILEQSTEGATLADIAHALPAPPDQRTLQRWLGMMIEGERVIADDSVSPTRYRAVTTTPATAATTNPTPAQAVPSTNLESQTITPADTSKATPAPPTNEPTAEELFAASVPRIVTSVLPKESAIPFLQNQAMLQLSSPEARRSFVAFAKARLETLTRDEAAWYGIEPEPYDFWRSQYTGATVIADPTSPNEAGAVSATDDEAQSRHPKRDTSTEFAAQASFAPKRSGQPARPRPTATPTSASYPSGSVASLQPTAAEIAGIVEPLRLGELRERGMAVAKATVTRKRAAVALVWGVLVVWGAQQLVIGAATHATAESAHRFAALANGLGYLVFPAAGLPWLFFRWRDRKKQKQKLDGIDATSALFLGGVLTFIAARFLTSILSTLMALLP
jgi:hypothetical protein